ncbi:MAG: NeuD/PglB/VioB family sugar acetyltransferase [Acidimicrobiales bacterium]|nr:NeuD/PglB/VioB family sugar acetyltransferase [Acidimicrobiales bacterium]
MWIYGAGGFGRETHDACLAAGVVVDGFLDDTPPDKQLRGLPVVRPGDVEPAPFVVAIADPQTRARLYRELVGFGWQPVTVEDPRAVIGTGATIGAGSILLATAFVSCDVVLAEATHLNYGVTIGHDVRAEFCTTVLPGANVGGSVELGQEVLVGSGAQVLQGVRIGRHAVIGAGAVVTSEVASGTTVVGVPAAPVER